MVSRVNRNSSISQPFAKLDIESQGYLTKSDLLSAFTKIIGNNASESANSSNSAPSSPLPVSA